MLYEMYTLNLTQKKKVKSASLDLLRKKINVYIISEKIKFFEITFFFSKISKYCILYA